MRAWWAFITLILSLLSFVIVEWWYNRNLKSIYLDNQSDINDFLAGKYLEATDAYAKFELE